MAKNERGGVGLLAQEKVLQLVLDTIPARVFWKDLDLNYLGCNQLAAEDAGLTSPAEIIGKNDFLLGWKAQAELYRADDRRVIESGLPKLGYEEPQTAPDGHRMWLRTSKIPLRDSGGAIIGVMGTYEDITERKLMEQALRASQEKLWTVLNAVPHPIFAKGADLKYTSCNVAFERLLGMGRQQIIGKGVREVFAREMAEIFDRADRELLASRGSQTYETQVRFADGTDHQVIFHKTVTQNGRGEVDGIVGIYFDISDLKRAEQERAKLEGQLRQAQKMESIGRLAGGVAHDLNNLLSPILGYAGLLLAGLAPGQPHHEELSEIERAAQRARDLIRQLLAFGRKQVLELKPVDLREVVTGFEKMLRRTIREDIRIEVFRPPSLGLARADVGQLEQVLMNLAVNAQDAMPGGGVLSIALADTVLDPSGAEQRPGMAPGPYVTLAVSDTGCGMDAATLQHLFEPFYTTKGPGRGTGLGLSTAYGIIKQHGGHITAYSEPGVGSTFKIYLPSVDDRLEPDGPPVTPSRPDQRGHETILVVEDNEMVRQIAGRLLERQGYRVLLASSASEALQLAEPVSTTVDLLLTDVIMPGMNGRALFDALRAARPGLRVLYMSGYDSNVVAHHGILEHGVKLLQKPFNHQTLSEKVRQVLDGTD
jgi:PAS domain S-box-containing protein